MHHFYFYLLHPLHRTGVAGPGRRCVTERLTPSKSELWRLSG